MAAAFQAHVVDELDAASDHVHDALAQRNSLPLGYIDIDSTREALTLAAALLTDLQLLVPDRACGDVDILEMATDLRVVADNLEAAMHT